MDKPRYSTKATRDLAVIFIITVSLLFLLYITETFETVVELSRIHEKWVDDEIILAGLVLLLSLSVFSLRRWRELRSKGDWAEEEDFIINLVQATRFLK